MQTEEETYTYQVKELKWYVFGKPATLTLSRSKIYLGSKEGKEIFSCNISDLAYADFDMDTASWTFKTKDGRKCRIQTHGIFAFANWKIRKTDINEKLRQYLDTFNVPSRVYEPIIKAKKH